MKMINAINASAATQIPPRRLRRKNVESSPPVAVPRCGSRGDRARPMVGLKAGHVSLLWESVIAHLDLGVRPEWLQDTRDDHGLAAVRPSFDGAMRSFIRLCN